MKLSISSQPSSICYQPSSITTPNLESLFSPQLASNIEIQHCFVPGQRGEDKERNKKRRRKGRGPAGGGGRCSTLHPTPPEKEINNNQH